jgi:hypothetical protein
MKTYNRDRLIIAALRKLWLWSPERRAVVAAARVTPTESRCSECRTVRPKKEIQVHHLNEVIPPGWSSKPRKNWNLYISRLFVAEKFMAPVCKECHKKHTAEERRQRKPK